MNETEKNLLYKSIKANKTNADNIASNSSQLSQIASPVVGD